MPHVNDTAVPIRAVCQHGNFVNLYKHTSSNRKYHRSMNYGYPKMKKFSRSKLIKCTNTHTLWMKTEMMVSCQRQLRNKEVKIKLYLSYEHLPPMPLAYRIDAKRERKNEETKHRKKLIEKRVKE